MQNPNAPGNQPYQPFGANDPPPAQGPSWGWLVAAGCAAPFFFMACCCGMVGLFGTNKSKPDLALALAQETAIKSDVVQAVLGEDIEATDEWTTETGDRVFYDTVVMKFELEGENKTAQGTARAFRLNHKFHNVRHHEEWMLVQLFLDPEDGERIDLLETGDVENGDTLSLIELDERNAAAIFLQFDARLGMSEEGEVLDIEALNTVALDDKHLQLLEEFDKLESLVTDARFTNKGLAHIIQADTINRLELPKHKATVRDIKTLTRLKKLERLTLNGAELADDDMAAFENFENLKYLKLEDADLSSEAAQELRTLLPGCEVVLDQDEPLSPEQD